jgi:hypothetical protein
LGEKLKKKINIAGLFFHLRRYVAEYSDPEIQVIEYTLDGDREIFFVLSKIFIAATHLAGFCK